MQNQKNDKNLPLWALSSEEVLQKLGSSKEGLAPKEATLRLKQWGGEAFIAKETFPSWKLFLRQFSNPIMWILLAATAVAFLLKEETDAIIILVILMASSILGYWQEKGAQRSTEKLLKMAQSKVNVIRHSFHRIPTEEVVPGDVILLRAGSVIPADCYILESKDLFVNEASLTGESFSVEKHSGPLPKSTSLNKRINMVYYGTFVLSGTATVIATEIGRKTEFGKVAQELESKKGRTEFEDKIRLFGRFLMQMTLVLVLVIFAFNLFFKRSLIESLLFSLALAIGLTPQLLPAIIAVNLAQGAKKMARRSVIVKKLISLENLGSMDVLCVDKTGTLTQGSMKISGMVDVEGVSNEKVFKLAYMNAFFQSSYTNPIDQALLLYDKCEIKEFKKLDEVPYDFFRKRISILAEGPQGLFISCKGAFDNVLSICSYVDRGDGNKIPLADYQERLHALREKYEGEGKKIIAVAYRPFEKKQMTMQDEKEYIFLGMIILEDPLKPRTLELIGKLNGYGFM